MTTTTTTATGGTAGALEPAGPPACPSCPMLLDELDFATRTIAALAAQLHAIRQPAASAACLLCAEKWRVAADRGQDTCPDPETHCAAVECECVCHDLPTRPDSADQDKAV